MVDGQCCRWAIHQAAASCLYIRCSEAFVSTVLRCVRHGHGKLGTVALSHEAAGAIACAVEKARTLRVPKRKFRPRLKSAEATQFAGYIAADSLASCRGTLVKGRCVTQHRQHIFHIIDSWLS